MGWLRLAKKVDWDEVRALAEQVRGGAMCGVYTEDPAYRHYSYGRTPYPEQPSPEVGGCDQLSDFLWDALDDLGYGSQARTEGGIFRVEGKLFEHAWVILEDHIIDITADQFNSALENPLPRIIITGIDDPRYDSEGPISL